MKRLFVLQQMTQDIHILDISNIEDHSRSEIAHFFQVYKDLERKKLRLLIGNHQRK